MLKKSSIQSEKTKRLSRKRFDRPSIKTDSDPASKNWSGIFILQGFTLCAFPIFIRIIKPTHLKNKIGAGLLCLAGVACSFALLSPWRSPFLNSDQSLQILMTAYLHLPGDLYFWGQDRLGSLVPILAHLLFTVIHLPPALAASLVLYALVGVLLAVISRFITSLSGRVLMVWLIFFPMHAVDNMLKLGHPYAPQYACIALFIACMYRFKVLFSEHSEKKAALFLFLGILSFDAALWISEMSAVVLPAFAIASLSSFGNFSAWREKLKAHTRIFIVYFVIVTVALGGGIWFILYAKSHGVSVPSYNRQWLSSRDEIAKGFSNYLQLYGNTLIGRNGLFPFLHNLLFLFLLASAIYLIVRNWILRKKAPGFLPLFFLLNGIGGELMIILSKWVALNHFNVWYQTYPYVSIVLFILLMRERHSDNPFISTLSLAWAVVAVISVSSIYYFQTGKDPNERSLRDMARLKELAPCGFIGNYWNSYLLWAADPVNLKAIPNEYPRCSWNIDSVMAAPNIYLVKNDWIDSFPRQITLYGRSLLFTRDTLTNSGFQLGRYRKASSSFPEKMSGDK
jgi:hypothetical protein